MAVSKPVFLLPAVALVAAVHTMAGVLLPNDFVFCLTMLIALTLLSLLEFLFLKEKSRFVRLLSVAVFPMYGLYVSSAYGLGSSVFVILFGLINLFGGILLVVETVRSIVTLRQNRDSDSTP